MKKEKKPTEENKENKTSGKAFLKKRAPIYLVMITVLVIFVVPELTKGTLEDYFPTELTENEKEAFDIFLNYRGPNNSGLNSIDVLSEKIKDDYPDGKIFDKQDTSVKFTVGTVDSNDTEKYKIQLNFETETEKTLYEWQVNIQTGEIQAMNPSGKNIIEIVDYSN